MKFQEFKFEVLAHTRKRERIREKVNKYMYVSMYLNVVAVAAWPHNEGRFSKQQGRFGHLRSSLSRANVVFLPWVCYNNPIIGEWTKLIYLLWLWLIYHLFRYKFIDPVRKVDTVSQWLAAYILVVNAFWLNDRTVGLFVWRFLISVYFRDGEVLVFSLFIFIRLFLYHNNITGECI